MDLSKIRQADWKHLEDEFKPAYMFLLHCSLINEREDLLAIKPENRNDFQQKRVAELELIYGKEN
jgi:hypothetical protein